MNLYRCLDLARKIRDKTYIAKLDEVSKDTEELVGQIEVLISKIEGVMRPPWDRPLQTQLKNAKGPARKVSTYIVKDETAKVREDIAKQATKAQRITKAQAESWRK